MWVGVSEGGAPSIYWPLQSLPSLPCPPHHTYIPYLNNHTMPCYIVTYTSIPAHPTVQYFALLKRSEACLSLHQILNWGHQRYEDTTDGRKSRKRKSESDHIAKGVRENQSNKWKQIQQGCLTLNVRRKEVLRKWKRQIGNNWESENGGNTTKQRGREKTGLSLLEIEGR